MKFNENDVKLNLNESTVESKVFVFKRKDSYSVINYTDLSRKEKHLSKSCQNPVGIIFRLTYGFIGV